MKEKNQYKLDEAIKEFYKIEPLQQDLATTVANKIFAEQKKESTVLDKTLLITLGFAVVVSLIYVLSLLSEISFATALMFVVAIVGFIGLSVKEHFVLLRRIQYQQ